MQLEQREDARDVRFCLNCNDMDDLATSEEVRKKAEIEARFKNCRETGNFDGDICARLYVADDAFSTPDLFADEEEDL